MSNAAGCAHSAKHVRGGLIQEAMLLEADERALRRRARVRGGFRPPGPRGGAGGFSPRSRFEERLLRVEGIQRRPRLRLRIGDPIARIEAAIVPHRMRWPSLASAGDDKPREQRAERGRHRETCRGQPQEIGWPDRPEENAQREDRREPLPAPCKPPQGAHGVRADRGIGIRPGIAPREGVPAARAERDAPLPERQHIPLRGKAPRERAMIARATIASKRRARADDEAQGRSGNGPQGSSMIPPSAFVLRDSA